MCEIDGVDHVLQRQNLKRNDIPFSLAHFSAGRVVERGVHYVHTMERGPKGAAAIHCRPARHAVAQRPSVRARHCMRPRAMTEVDLITADAAVVKMDNAREFKHDWEMPAWLHHRRNYSENPEQTHCFPRVDEEAIA